MLEQRQQGNVADLDDLELHSGNVSYSLSFASLSGNKNFIVDFHKVQASVPWNKGSDLFGVLDQLNTGNFTNSRIGLFRFNTTKGREGKLEEMGKKRKGKEKQKALKSDSLSSFPNVFNKVEIQLSLFTESSC